MTFFIIFFGPHHPLSIHIIHLFCATLPTVMFSWFEDNIRMLLLVPLCHSVTIIIIIINTTIHIIITLMEATFCVMDTILSDTK